MSTKALKVGVAFEECQFSDISPMDLIWNMSTECFDITSKEFPEFLAPITGKTFSVQWFFPSSSTEPARMTPLTFRGQPNCTYEDCPRDLDILLIGGPLLSHRPKGAAKLFRDICANPNAIVMTTCTGALWLAASGAIDGRTATVNRATIPIGQQMHPKVTWKDQRWYVDAAGEGKCELWTAGGAFAGVDMVATFVHEKYDKMVASMACFGLDIDPTVRGQFYNTPPPWEMFAQQQQQQKNGA